VECPAAPNATTLLATLLLVVLALAATRVLLGIVNWIKGLQANKVGVALTFELRSQLVRKLHALGVGYYDRHQVGSLVSRVAYDSEVLHTLLQVNSIGFTIRASTCDDRESPWRRLRPRSRPSWR
jgi:ATP-binding cassette, subfamily B, bacterial